MPYRVMYTTNVDRCLLERVRHLSEEVRIRPNQLLEQALEEYLERHDQHVKKDPSKNKNANCV